MVLLWPLPAEAQEPPARKVPRLGVLMSTPTTEAFQEAFRQGLRDHGFVEDRTFSSNGDLKTATRLGLRVPPSLRLRAGQVIE
jgi:hypothetical protein